MPLFQIVRERVEWEIKAAQKPARILPLQFSETLRVGRGKKAIKRTFHVF